MQKNIPPSKRWSSDVEMLNSGHTRKNTPFIHRPSVLSSDSSRYQNSYRSSYQFSSPTDDLVFDHFDRQYLFCCGRSHSTVGVRIITGMLCLSVLYEFWLIIQHILTTNQQHSLPIFDSLVQLLFGFLLAISMVLALWLENCALLLPYLLMQFIGIGSFLTILLALLYIVVLDRDLETIEYLIDKYVPFNLTEGQTDGYKICLGLLLCTACFSLLIFQLWLLSIVISCWRYFRDKQTFFIQNNRDTTCIILHPINQINIENKN